MAFSINHITLLGNVSKDPEAVKYTKGGTAILNLSMATNRSIKDGDGYKNVGTFHRIVIYGKMAEWVYKNVQKGTKIYIDGRIENRSWEKQDGSKAYITEVVAENIIPMQGDNFQKQVAEAVGAEPTEEQMNSNTGHDIADDIPF